MLTRHARRSGGQGEAGGVAGMVAEQSELGDAHDRWSRFPLDNVDSWRGPTASQAAGLTLAAARAVIAAAQAEARRSGSP